MQNRTLEELRKSLIGKIYIHLKDTETCRIFFKDAEKEGFTFGGNKPTESPTDDIIALENRKQLSHVGFVGHMVFHSPESVDDKQFYCIDYAKFKSGRDDYIIESSSSNNNNNEVTTLSNVTSMDSVNKIDITGMFHTEVIIIGDSKEMAAKYIKDNAITVTDIDSEEELFQQAEDKFGVIILF